MAEAQSIFNYQREVFTSNGELILRYSDLDRDLIISKKSTEVEISQRPKTSLESKSQRIQAIYGIMSLKECQYLVVVTKASLIGSLMSRQIFLADQFYFIPIGYEKISSSDSSAISGLKQIFQTKTFYFSENFDLTNSLQRQMENKGIRKPIPYFCINYEFIKVLRFCNPELWAPIFISGLVIMKYLKLNGIDCQIALISRRDQRRMGRRFISRGADLEGNCSNFAETEQIFMYRNKYFSYLQNRGSIPFKWQQKPDLKWAPKGQILGNDSQNLEVTTKHFVDQFKLGIQKYVLINLIDKKGNQKLLGDYFQKMIANMQNQNVRYVWFDFHHECRGMKYQNIGKLIDSIRQDIDLGDIFSMEIKEQIQSLNQINIFSTQKCMLRTNCIDCLDRTNVVQSVLARHILWGILQKMGIQRNGNSAMEAFPQELEQIFRDIWTVNADTISLLYTGTGALKTDSTKKGKRTKMGAMQDGYRSIKRYFIGNFYDGGIQNSIDLLTNKIDLKQQKYSSSLMAGWHILFLIFATIGLASYKISDYVIKLPWIQENLGLVIQKSENAVNNSRIYGFQIAFILGTLFLVKQVVFRRHSMFVRQSYLDH